MSLARTGLLRRIFCSRGGAEGAEEGVGISEGAGEAEDFFCGGLFEWPRVLGVGFGFV